MSWVWLDDWLAIQKEQYRQFPAPQWHRQGRPSTRTCGEVSVAAVGRHLDGGHLVQGAATPPLSCRPPRLSAALQPSALRGPSASGRRSSTTNCSWWRPTSSWITIQTTTISSSCQSKPGSANVCCRQVVQNYDDWKLIHLLKNFLSQRRLYRVMLFSS